MTRSNTNPAFILQTADILMDQLAKHVSSLRIDTPSNVARHDTKLNETDVEHDQLVSQVLAMSSARLAIVDSDVTAQARVVQNLIQDSRVSGQFAGRCVFVSCDDASSAGVVLDRLAAELGVLESGGDAFGAVLESLANHDHTLVILDELDAVYQPVDLKQQDETDVFLATLAAVDELTLIVTFSGPSLPESVSWTVIDRACEVPSEPEPQVISAGKDPISIAMTQANARIDPGQDGKPTSALEVSGDTGLIVAANSTIGRFETTVPADTKNADEEPDSSYPLFQPRTVYESRRPPARPAVFHGRDKELSLLVDQALVLNSAPLGIVGPGGIGKTTLALKVLHHSRVRAHFGKERLFLSCEESTTPDEVLTRLAGKLGAQRVQGVPLWTVVIDKLRTCQQTLLIIDNFESIWSPTDNELREASEVFLAQLAVLDELTLIVTTRGNHLPENFTWANAVTAELDTLSSTAARSTFTDLSCLKPAVLASELEAESLTELLREIDFMPLAITLLARLDDLPSSLLREWSEYHTEVLEADRHDGTRRELSVEVSIKISLAHLPDETEEFSPRQLLSVLGQLPAGLFPMVATQLEPAITNLKLASEVLLRHSLAYSGGQSELRMLSPVQHYVSAHLPMSRAAQFAVDQIYVNIAHGIPDPSRVHLELAYDAEIPNVRYVLTRTLDRISDACAEGIYQKVEDLCQICVTFSSYCLLRGYPGSMQLLQKTLLLFGKYPVVKAGCIQMIAYSHSMWSDQHLALEYFQQALDLYRDLGDTDEECQTRQGMAWVLDSLGRPQDAAECRAAADELRRRSARFSYDAGPAPEEDLVAAEQRFRDNREQRQRMGDIQAVTSLSFRILDIVESRSDRAALVTELELSMKLCDQIAPQDELAAPLKIQLAFQYLEDEECDSEKLSRIEDLAIEAYTAISIDNHPGVLARATILLAAVRLRQGRYEEASQIYLVASERYRRYGLPQTAEEARQCSERARQLSEQLRTHPDLLLVKIDDILPAVPK